MVRNPSEIDEIVGRTIDVAGEFLEIKAVYLFGSYFGGVPHPGSDIDIAIFADNVDQMDVDEQIEIASRIALKVSAEVEIHLFSSLALNDLRPTNFAGYIASNGRKVAA